MGKQYKLNKGAICLTFLPVRAKEATDDMVVSDIYITRLVDSDISSTLGHTRGSSKELGTLPCPTPIFILYIASSHTLAESGIMSVLLTESSEQGANVALIADKEGGQ